MSDSLKKIEQRISMIVAGWVIRFILLGAGVVFGTQAVILEEDQTLRLTEAFAALILVGGSVVWERASVKRSEDDKKEIARAVIAVLKESSNKNEVKQFLLNTKQKVNELGVKKVIEDVESEFDDEVT